jgi:hypothetical protein
MPHVTTLQLRSAAGYTAEAMLRRGDFGHAAGQQNGSVTLGSSCSVNHETAAVEPFQLTLKNTTTGFSASPALNIVAATPEATLLPKLEAEIGYAEGPQCVSFQEDVTPGDESGGYLSFSPNSALAPGRSITAEGFFILASYYSPAEPDGEGVLLEGDLLQLEPGFGSEAVTVTSSSGALHSSGIPAAVPLLPGGSGGCLIRPPCDVPDPTAGVP